MLGPGSPSAEKHELEACEFEVPENTAQGHGKGAEMLTGSPGGLGDAGNGDTERCK